MQKVITILDVRYEIELVTDKAKWKRIQKKMKFGDISGFVDVNKKKITVFVYRYKNGIYMWDTLEKTIWHEVGHAIEHEMPTSVVEDEYIPVVCEYMANICPQIPVIMEELVHETEEKNKKGKKNGR